MVQPTILTGDIHSIETMSTLDGPGLRTVVFMQGCPLKCLFCHNIDCTVHGNGKQYTVEALVEELLKNKEYWSKKSKTTKKSSEKDVVGGVTFSGGEPLQQSTFLLEVVRRLHEEGVSVYVDTCLHTHYSSIAPLLEFVDGWIISLKPVDHSEHEKYTGVSNELIHKNIITLDRALYREGKKNIRIRFLVVPGLTDTVRNLALTTYLLKPLKAINSIEFLKYGDHGKYKWEELFGGYKFEFPNATDDDVKKVASELEKLGLEMII